MAVLIGIFYMSETHGSRHLSFAVICSINGDIAILGCSCNGGLICIKTHVGQYFKVLTLQTVSYIFTPRTQQLKKISGSAGRPPHNCTILHSTYILNLSANFNRLFKRTQSVNLEFKEFFFCLVSISNQQQQCQ